MNNIDCLIINKPIKTVIFGKVLTHFELLNVSDIAVSIIIIFLRCVILKALEAHFPYFSVNFRNHEIYVYLFL